MSGLPEEQKQKIVEALRERGAFRSCPRCGNNGFTLLDGYSNQQVQADIGVTVLGGPSIPTIVVVCNRCGWLAQHALGFLGLLRSETGAAGGGQG